MLYENDITVISSRYELRHDKTNKMSVRPVKTQISLGICPVWLESSLSAWTKLGSLATHWAHGEDWSDWVDCWFCHVAAYIVIKHSIK